MNELEQLAREQARFILNNMERRFGYHSAFYDWESLSDHLFNQLRAVATNTAIRTWEEAAEISNDHKSAMIAVRQPNKRVMKWMPMRNPTEIFRAKAAALKNASPTPLVRIEPVKAWSPSPTKEK